MSISIPSTTSSNVAVERHEKEDGSKGYLLQIAGATQVFIAEADADRLARFLLFGEEVVDNG